MAEYPSFAYDSLGNAYLVANEAAFQALQASPAPIAAVTAVATVTAPMIVFKKTPSPTAPAVSSVHALFVRKKPTSQE